MKDLLRLYLLLSLLILGLNQQIKTDLTQGSFSISAWSYQTTNTCGDNTIMWFSGVYDAYSSSTKVFSGLFTHTSVTISFTAYYINTWDGYNDPGPTGNSLPPYYDSAMLWIDGALAFHRVYAADGNEVNSCQSSPSSYTLSSAYIATQTVYNYPHTNPTITLEFSSGLNQAPPDEAFGVSDLTISVNLVCDPTCYTCNGNYAYQCTSCIGTRYLSGTTCVTACASNQYADSATNKCIGCDNSCLTCSGGAVSDCTSCASGSYLEFPPTGTCSSSCPPGYWQNSAQNQCTQCYQGSILFYTCATCYSAGSSACLSCNPGSFLYRDECVNPCPPGYWGDTSSKQCSQCYQSSAFPHYSCATCSGGSASTCTSCHPNYYLYNGQCLSQCNAGYWADSNSNCQPCWTSTASPFSCKTCSDGGNSDCQSCNPGYYLYPNTGGQCLSSCPNGYWADSSAWKCQSCWGNSAGPYYTCATCSGTANNQCLSCNSGNFLYSNQCLGTCPTGFWGDNTSNTCNACWSSNSIAPFSCLTCNSPSSGGCLSCNSGYFLYPSTQGQCLQTCPDGFWPRRRSGTCNSCWVNTVNMTNPYSCKTCASGGFSSECTSCTLGTFLYPNTGGQCISPCPNGFWEDTYTNTCQACWSSTVQPYSCATCNGTHSTNCLTCNSGSFLYEGQCINPCPDGYWGDTTVNQCKSCWASTSSPFSCKTCDAGTSSNCTGCNIGTFQYPMSYGSCLGVCPNGFYADNSVWECKPCYLAGIKNKSACATCTGPLATNCTTCSTPSTFYSPADNSCVTTCPPSYYADTSSGYPNNQCRKCYQYNPSFSPNGTCATCSGPASYQCLSCNSPRFLDSTTNTCVNTCPTGWWGNSSSSRCQLCYQTALPTDPVQKCYTCNGPSSGNCTSCSSGSFYYTPNNTCLLSCPLIGYWGDSSSNQCKTCYQYTGASPTENTCVTCNGSSYNNCLSCNSTTFLDLTTNQCVNSCPSGYYGDNSTNLCKACNSASNPSPDVMKSCKTCSGPTATNCSSCNSLSYLYSVNNTCLAGCPNGWYPNTTLNACNSCYQNLPPSTWGSCATCTGPMYNNCQSCVVTTTSSSSSSSSSSLSVYFYNPASNTCVNPCPAGTYTIQTTMQCAPCFQTTSSSNPNAPQSCFTCNGPLSTNCLSCQNGFYYYPKASTCVTTCPIGSYLNLSYVCDSCFVSISGSFGSCASCVGPNPTDCTSCSRGTYLNNQASSCVISCPNGTYADDQTWICQPCYFALANDSQFSCATCDGPLATQCLSCAPSLALITSSGSCSDTCPCDSGYFYDSTAGICGPCHSSCTYCTGPADSDCKFDTSSNNQCLVSGFLVNSNKRPQKTGVVAQGGSDFTAVIALITNILSGGITMGAPTVLSILSLFELYQYLNVNYPSNVVIFFQYMFAGNPLNVANLFVSAAHLDSQLIIEDSIVQGENKFNEFQVSNLFLVNAGGDLSLLLCLLLVAPVIVSICHIFSWMKELNTNHKSRIEAFMIGVKKFFVWNFTVSYFMGAFVHILLAACIQLRYLVPTQDFFANFSIFMSMVVTLGYPLFIGLLVYISRSKRFEATRHGLMTHENLMVLRNEEQQTQNKLPAENLKNRYWAFVLCSRNLILVPIITMLSNTPIAQCTLAMLINIAFLVTISVWKFSASAIKRVIIRICEGINVLIPFCFLLYGVDDMKSATSNDKMSIQGKFSLGWFIIVLISLNISLNLLYTLIETWNILWQLLPVFYRGMKNFYSDIKTYIRNFFREWEPNQSTEIIETNPHVSKLPFETQNQEGPSTERNPLIILKKNPESSENVVLDEPNTNEPELVELYLVNKKMKVAPKTISDDDFHTFS